MTGAVIALTIKQPVLAITLSFLSHYATDALPHYGVKLKEVYTRNFNLYVAADFVFAICLMIILGFVFPESRWLIWACMVAAAIPDIVWLYYRKIMKMKLSAMDRVSRFHGQLNNHVKHIYYDAAWFSLMWLIVLLIKF
jgi:hypothetical protein